MILRYKSALPLYKLMSILIKLIPIPRWVTIKTKYGLMLVPKEFRIITMTLDLVEPEIKHWFEHSLKRARTFIDVGAAYGYYTLKAAKLMDGSILAFEPDPLIFKVLEANLAINDVKNIKTFNVVLSDVNGEINFRGHKVKARRLDTIVKEEQLELKNTVVKIDVEGMALNVLKGAICTLRSSKPSLVCELHSGEEAVEPFLIELGYKVSKLSKYFIVAE